MVNLGIFRCICEYKYSLNFEPAHHPTDDIRHQSCGGHTGVLKIQHALYHFPA